MANGTGAGAGFSGLASLVKAISAVSGAIGQSRARNTQADIFNAQARRERAVSEREAMDFRRRTSRIEASARARRAVSGVDPGSGTALLTQGDLAAEAELGALDILNVGAARATQLQNQARLQRFAGRSAIAEGAARAGTTLLTEDNFDFASSFFAGDEEPLSDPFGNPSFVAGRAERLPGRV